MRTTLILCLVLLLMVIALPALGETQELDSGVTVVNNTALAPAGIPNATVKFVEAITGGSPVASESYGGSLNLAD
jgi:hypothetical protein